MCDLCRCFPCNSRCPNAEEPQAIYTCACCGESIIEGEYYYRVGSDCFHEECLEYRSLYVLKHYFGICKEIAEVE